MRSRVLASAIVIAVLSTSAHPALASSCQSWRRMTESQRWDRIYQMIDDAMASQRGREYEVNRAAIGRCLEGHVESMYWDFTDTCEDSSTARAQAVSRIFKNYVWSCIQ
jgi:hypothetical protein